MISPEKKTIEDILKGSRITYSVPEYQRNFDWGKSELQDLLDDIKDTKSQDNKNLFLGNFIFETSDQSNYKIVDGQQRLTAISIILIAIREHAKKINEKIFAGEIQPLITSNSSWNNEKGNKIVVSNNIREVFEFISQNDWNGKWPDQLSKGSAKKQVNKIKPILLHIMSELSEYSLDDLKNFTQALLYSYVVVINVETHQDVFAIFERTNARGLDLNIGDLLKNYLFSHDLSLYEEKWNEIILNAQSQLQRMLKYFWVSRKGYSPQSALYKNFKIYAGEIGVEQFVDELYSFSRYYRVTQLPNIDEVRNWLEEFGLNELASNEDHYSQVSRVLQALKFFRVTQAYPLIYSILISYKNTNRSYKNLFKILESIEKFHFVNNVIAVRIGNDIEKLYSEKSPQFFYTEHSFIDNVNSLIAELKRKKAHRAEFIENFTENVVYEKVALINYIYDRINNHDAKGGQRINIFNPEKDLKQRNYNIDHILPQNDKKLYIDDKRLDLFDTIGNLIILPSHSNSSFQNLSPKDKYDQMIIDTKHQGGLKYLMNFLNDYKDSFNHWGFDVIKKRSEKIAEHSYDTVWNF